MTLGSKIKTLRAEKGLTQKDLAKKVNVSFQTVSKWENDENEPDIATLKELSKLFGCSLDFLLSEEEVMASKKKSENPEVLTKETSPINQTIIIHEPALRVCSYCHKPIEPEDLHVENAVTSTRRRGRHRVSSTGSPSFYHKDCYVIVEQRRKEHELQVKIENGKRKSKRCWIWSTIIGVLAFVITLIILLTAGKEAVNAGVAVGLSFLVSYGLFSGIYCFFSGSYVADVFISVSGWSIKFPGLIFTWDLDGIAWVIAMKIFFAICGFIISGLVLCLAVFLTAALSMISFPFVLIHNIHTHYEDAF